MPTLTQIKADAIVTAATAAMATASTNLAAATSASDAAHAAILSAVRAGGYDSFKIASGSVSVPARLRSWTAADGLSSAWTSIGLDSLVTTHATTSATTARRQRELDGLQYIISQAKGLQAAVAPESSDTDVLTGLQTILAAITASQAA